MIRAILGGRKTMTRRVLKLRDPSQTHSVIDDEGDGAWPYDADDAGQWHKARCPYGQPGDRLWVRETFMIHGGEIAFAATDQPLVGCDKWKPSIFMTRLASRITLEVVAVRVDRLQDITEEDAIAEGMHEFHGTGIYGCDPHGTPGPLCGDSAGEAFRLLWLKINGVDSWTANPWVWVVEFTRVLEAPSHG
jgi:hypothetical protein